MLKLITGVALLCAAATAVFTPLILAIGLLQTGVLLGASLGLTATVWCGIWLVVDSLS